MHGKYYLVTFALPHDKQSFVGWVERRDLVLWGNVAVFFNDSLNKDEFL